jgi:heat shock protein HslJ
MRNVAGVVLGLLAGGVLMAGSLDKPQPAAGLESTLWQGVTVTSPSGQVLEGSPSNYRLEFAKENSVRLKLDCNSAGGSYQATDRGGAQGDLRIGPLRMTRARCPEGSLDQVIAGMMGGVRTYRIIGETLVLEIDGGGSLTWR